MSLCSSCSRKTLIIIQLVTTFNTATSERRKKKKVPRQFQTLEKQCGPHFAMKFYLTLCVSPRKPQAQDQTLQGNIMKLIVAEMCVCIAYST